MQERPWLVAVATAAVAEVPIAATTTARLKNKKLTTADAAHVKGCVGPGRERDDADKPVSLEEAHCPLLERVDGVIARALGRELLVGTRVG